MADNSASPQSQSPSEVEQSEGGIDAWPDFDEAVKSVRGIFLCVNFVHVNLSLSLTEKAPKTFFSNSEALYRSIIASSRQLRCRILVSYTNRRKNSFNLVVEDTIISCIDSIDSNATDRGLKTTSQRKVRKSRAQLLTATNSSKWGMAYNFKFSFMDFFLLRSGANPVQCFPISIPMD
eukprot:Gb_18063 [translate_table: standard]